MRKTDKVVFALLFIMFMNLGTALAADTVKMRTILVNPSSEKPQKKSIKNYLPKEIKMKNIIDAGGLEIEYDEEQGMFFAFKQDVELAPGETKTYELVMEDVWMVPDDNLDRLRERTENAMQQLVDTRYFAQADLIAKTIYGRLEEIKRTQNDANVTKQQHIAYFRENLKVLDAIEADIYELEKILVAVGGTPNLKVIEDAKIDLKSPNTKTTWILIFSILIFIAILGGAFYFTWQGQVKVTENIFVREKDLSFTEFKGKDEEKKDK